MNGSGGREFRADVEGLRAVAVALVVAFHADLVHSAGGFVGVDVFFVLSGFLITGLLLDERFRTGTISLSGFWSRRARRLLPAASLTIVATLVAARFILPPLQRRSVTTDGLFSAVFLANVRFAESLGDYFGNQLAEAYPSPFLHYWSLAVEEQFYLVWPIAVLVAMRFGRHPRRNLMIGACIGAAASFALAVWWTPRRPEAAFYLLPTRMCELLAGAILSIAGPRLLASVPAATRALLGWVGIGGIAVATVTYSEATAFPGYAAVLPVLGTVALLVSGSGVAPRYGPQRLLSARPLQWIGGRSYAIYLWHWPALVLLQAHDPDHTPLQRLVAVVASVALAAVSVRLVENPIRFARSLAAPASRGLVLGVAVTVVTVGAIGVVSATQPGLDGADRATAVTLESARSPSIEPSMVVTSTSNPTGAPAPVDSTGGSGRSAPAGDSNRSRLAELETEMQAILGSAAATEAVPSNLRPSLADAARDTAQVYFDACISLGDTAEVRDCRYGAVGSDDKIVLFGDSHAAQWFPAVDDIATANGAELVVLLKGGCPVAAVPSTRADLVESCPAWRSAAIAAVVDLEPSMLIASSLSGYTTDDELWNRGLVDVLTELEPAIGRLVLILDTPRQDGSPPICLSDHLDSADACVARRADAVHETRASAERAAAAIVGAEVIDPTPWFCTPSDCPVIVGDALMYRDVDHITTVAARLLEPLLEAALFPDGADGADDA